MKKLSSLVAAVVVTVALTATGATAQTAPETDAVPVAAEDPLGSEGWEFVGVAPCAVFDTRSGSGGFAGRLAGGTSRRFQVTGAVPASQGGQTCSKPPADAVAVVLNLVAVDGQAPGNLQIAAAGVVPNGGVVNFVAGDNNSNALPVAVSAGAVDVINSAGGGSVHVRGVVLGYYTDKDATGLEFVGVAPCAVFDTRTGSGGFAGRLAGGKLRRFQVTGAVPASQGGQTCSKPPADAVAVVLNLVAVDGQAPGNLQIAAAGVVPNGGVVNFVAGDNNSNALPVAVSAGAVDVINTAGGGSVHVRGVVLGYYGGSSVTPTDPDTCPECEPITAYGVRSDTPTADQTNAIRNAVNTGRNLYFPPGTYCVNDRISLWSGQTIEVREGASVRICGNHSDGVAVFMFRNISNARLIGAGELRDTSAEGAWGGNRWRRFGVEIRGGADNLVSGLTLRDFRADGVYLESHYSTPRVDPRRITIRDVKTDAIERNGMTLNVGTDITVDRLQCRNGVPRDVQGKFGDTGIVGACLFFEPNVADQSLRRITVNDLYAENNATAVTFGAVWHNENSPAHDVTFNRPVSVRDRESYDIRNNFLAAPGDLRFVGARSVDARWRAVSHYRTNGRGFRTTFTGLEIVRFGSNGGSDTQAVRAWASGTSRTDIQPDYPFGNLHVHFAHVPTRHPSASGTDVVVHDNRQGAEYGGCVDIFLDNATGVALGGNATSCVTRS